MSLSAEVVSATVAWMLDPEQEGVLHERVLFHPC